MAATIERILITTCILAIVPCSGNSAAAADVDYLREIKPLLAAHCTRCHGPLKQEGKLRLDTVPFMKRGGKQGAAIVPRRSTESLLIEMISGKGGLQMPPKGSGEKLEANEIARLREWIDQGAKAPLEAAAELVKYWAFQVPSRPTVPTNGSPEWSRNPIDAFVSMSHQRHKLIPRPLASKPVLLRRVYLDLIGLPPSQAELREFLADESPDAYEKVVERLLASPHFGERWARHWLDVWRYSDWYGFMAEVRYSHQHIWRWRDWVVQSLNDDRGYDQMIVNMLAADEQTPFQVKDLPATGFLVRNRNTDSREAWISDTVEHTAKAFLGLTVACARCHDHMSDPIPQTDYYRFRAVFEPHDVAIDTIPGGGGIARVYDARSSTPTYLFVRGNDRQPDKSQVILPGVPASLGGRWVDPQPTELAVLSRIPALRDDVHAATLRIQSEDLARARSELEHARQALVKIEAITKAEGIPAKANPKDPRRGKVVFEDRFTKLDTERWMIGPGEWKAQDGKLTQRTAGGSDAKWIRTNAKHPRDFAAELRFRVIGGVRYRSVGIRFDASETHSQGVFATANQAAPALAFFSEVSGTRQSLESLRRPYALELNNEITMRVEVRDQLVNAYLNGRLIQAYRLGTDRRDGVLELFTTDAHAEFLEMRLEELSPTAVLEETVPCGEAPDLATVEGRQKWRQQAERVVELTKYKLATLEAQQSAYAAVMAAERFKYFEPLSAKATAEQKEQHKQKQATLFIAAGRAQRAAAIMEARQNVQSSEDTLTQARACAKELKQPAQTMVSDAEKKLQQSRDKLDLAEKNNQKSDSPTYSGFPSVAAGGTGRRLALAQWIASNQNPLTARVAVNHVWLRHLGQPLVPTVFDFGLAGVPSTHPELLDWLASEWMRPSMRWERDEQGGRWVAGQSAAKPWSFKHLHRLIVTSRIYRSQSDSDPENVKIDPDNRYLWRANVRRLDAEIVRDSVLHVAGHLDRTLGGPDLPAADGMTVFRRSLYFRSNPDQQMEFLKVFDAASPVECYERTISVVPQQALAMANSQLTVIQSRRLAKQLAEKYTDRKEFVQAVFEQVLARSASAEERRLALEFLEQRFDFYRKNPKGLPKQPAEAAPFETPANDSELRAREILVHAILNHSDFVTVR